MIRTYACSCGDMLRLIDAALHVPTHPVLVAARVRGWIDQHSDAGHTIVVEDR